MEKVTEHLNKTVWATLRPSKIQGVGVFAIRDIPKGTNFTHYQFEKIFFPASEIDRLEYEVGKIILDRTLMTEDENMITHPNKDVDLTAFMNHSYEPNSNGFTALRDIEKGEEITENYRDRVRGYPLIPAQEEYMAFLKW